MNATIAAMKAAQTYAIEKTHSEVAFQVRHLLTKVRGPALVRPHTFRPEQLGLAYTACSMSSISSLNAHATASAITRSTSASMVREAPRAAARTMFRA
jgi:hypothetical protein